MNDQAKPAAPEEPFLARWSRRKRAGSSPAADAPAAEHAPAVPAPDAGAPPEPVLTDADMPPLESLDEHSDVSPFLSPGVSDGLRRLALRKLFSTSAYNLTDGLDDYAEDFREFEALGDVLTADLRHRLEMERERQRERERAQQEQAAEAGRTQSADAGEAQVPDPDPADPEGDPGEDV